MTALPPLSALPPAPYAPAGPVAAKTVRRALLVGRYQTEGVAATLLEIAASLQRSGVIAVFETETAQAIQRLDLPHGNAAELGPSLDMAIAVGGDGTMLGLCRELAPFDVPLIGINHGRLGFVTDIALEAWPQALGQILEGHYSIEERSLLQAHVRRAGESVWQAVAMNDVVVSRSSRAGMIELQVEVDGIHMYNQRADGLIIATPTGSTAYALSANGPILHPQVAGLVLVPVAPQSLSNRPIVLPDSVSIVIRVVEGREPRVAADMQVFSDLQDGDDIVIARAPYRVRFLHPPGYSHFATLRNKLNWHELPIGRVQRSEAWVNGASSLLSNI
jgi:NAD+ kinase